jgi:hypothetical protein
MSKFVVVRGPAADIATAVGTTNGTAGAGIAPLDPAGPHVIEIVQFDAPNEDEAVPFSLNPPEWYGTVFDTLKDAEANAIQRAEGD